MKPILQTSSQGVYFRGRLPPPQINYKKTISRRHQIGWVDSNKTVVQKKSGRTWRRCLVAVWGGAWLWGGNFLNWFHPKGKDGSTVMVLLFCKEFMGGGIPAVFLEWGVTCRKKGNIDWVPPIIIWIEHDERKKAGVSVRECGWCYDTLRFIIKF